jgi:hypothetical protein
VAKIYKGKRARDGVVVEVLTFRVRKGRRRLRHIPFHSATKGDLNWGYGGSGPADLALAILVDYFHEHAPSKGYRAGAACNTWMTTSRAWKVHQDFKWRFVATFADEWEAHSLAASPSTTTRKEACRVAAQEQLSHKHSPPKTRSSFAPAYRRLRSLRLRAGGRPWLATAPHSR